MYLNQFMRIIALDQFPLLHLFYMEKQREREGGDLSMQISTFCQLLVAKQQIHRVGKAIISIVSKSKVILLVTLD